MGHNSLNRRSDPVMEPIIIDSDYESDSSGTIDNDPDARYFLDVDAESSTGRRAAAPALLSSLGSSAPGEGAIDLTESCFNEGDYLTDECFQRLVSSWQDPAAVAAAPRPPSREPERRIIPEACMDGILYRPGHSVELFDESYLRIETVVEDGTGSVFLHGRRMIQTASHADRCIPKWQNELVWMVDETSQVPLEIVKQFVSIIFTNWCKFEREQQYRSKLFCRLKETKKANSTAVEYLSFEDADPNHRFHPRLLCQNWRGETRLFGKDDAGNGAIDLDDSPVIDLTDSNIRRYTFGDGFCGAGGVSAGASQAGFNIKWAFDKSSHAATTYRLNFPTAMCEESDIFSFLTNDADFVRVDVSHGSPPCQTFSPAHTIECANDDANSACIFSCSDLIKKAKPRVHTMEETCGLFERHKEVFFRVIQDFIELGYSVRYGVLNCMDYGVPQSRRRLIIIASGYVPSLTN